ncbi:MAG TPA: NAD-dependent epimerase/dehydratase family protein, partial [Nevskiales bacterium]|nr:NAD-dependent epimerase/dehydratase family protein [Nevskiales bacterium]
MNIDKTKPVLVTGGNGYIASWLVKYLLEQGVNVRATVRDPSNEKKVGHLKRIAAKTPGRLALFQADLLQAGAFNGPMKGCELVFHT